MRSLHLLLATAVCMLWVGQGRAEGDGKKSEASADPKKDGDGLSDKEGSAPEAPTQPEKDGDDGLSDKKVTDPEDSPEPEEEDDVFIDEVVDNPDAFDDQSCDDLWAEVRKEGAKSSPDEIVEWTHVCALKHGLCPLHEPYWYQGFAHMRITFIYRHEILTIKTQVSTPIEERCSQPSVDWEKVGEKYRRETKLRRFAKPAKTGKGKRRHQRRSKPAKIK